MTFPPTGLPGRAAGPARRALLAAAAMAVAACGTGPLVPEPDTSPPPRPAGAIDHPATADLQAAIDRAPAGATLALAPGIYRGPLRIDKPLTLWGPRNAVVETSGVDSTVTATADSVALMGFTVRGSGSRFDLLDSAVRIRGKDVRVLGLRIEQALFGILVEQSSNVELRGNRIAGTGQKALGLRGDGIRLWETTDSEVTGNHVTDCRDLVVWYSSRNTVADNRVEGSRYGTHFMYSHENRVHGNCYLENVVGLFVMYSRDIEIRDNLIARCHGAAGVGLGVKESGNLTVSGNLFLQNTTGTYLDTSPLQLDHHNLFEANVFRFCDTAVVFHSSPRRNRFLGNSLRDNTEQVRVSGGGDALAIEWAGNDFDDYRGYDLDRDGYGDIPYELRSLASDLTGRYPALAFFRGTPSLAMVDLAAHVLPIFAPRQILVDERPRMQPLAVEWRHAR